MSLAHSKHKAQCTFKWIAQDCDYAGNDSAASPLQVQAGDPPVDEACWQRGTTHAQRWGGRYSLTAQSQKDCQPQTVALHHGSEEQYKCRKEQDLRGRSFLLCGLAGASILPWLRAGRHSKGNHMGVLGLKFTVLK